MQSNKRKHFKNRQMGEIFPLLGGSKKKKTSHKSENKNIYLENLVHTYQGLVLATSVSKSPFRPCFTDLTSHVLLFCWSPLWTPTIFPLSLPWGSPISKGKNLAETSNLDSPYNVWLWVMGIFASYFMLFCFVWLSPLGGLLFLEK